MFVKYIIISNNICYKFQKNDKKNLNTKLAIAFRSAHNYELLTP